MGFGDLKAKAGQQTLNDYLADKSYIEGWVISV
jgi:elongation factor 1-beta